MPRQPQLRSVCFTLNNYTADEFESIKAIDAEYMVVGRETGENETPHLQGYIKFHKRMVFSAVKALLPRAHIEKAQGSPQQNDKYCSKQDKEPFRKGELPAQGKRTDLSLLVEDIESGERDPKKLRAAHPAVCARYGAFVRQLLIDHRPKPSTPEITLRPWQVQCLEIIKAPVHDRKIHFFVDHNGNAGKSTFCTYIESLFDHVQVMKPGRYQDMAYELVETTTILLFDCPRSREENIRYDFLEDVKDGRVTNSKYESYQKRLDKCRVIVFCNFDPDESKLSHDRLDITTIN